MSLQRYCNSVCDLEGECNEVDILEWVGEGEEWEGTIGEVEDEWGMFTQLEG